LNNDFVIVSLLQAACYAALKTLYQKGGHHAAVRSHRQFHGVPESELRKKYWAEKDLSRG
jgi:hypothetical protein